jgi:hypothetical protein
MLVFVRMMLPTYLSPARIFSKQLLPCRSRLVLTLAAVAWLCLTPVLITGCSRASAGTTSAASAQEIESAREQLDLIPPPSKTRYMAVRSISTWENPYLTVQQNIATLHVTLADANPSDLGVGGMLRPVGARQQVLTIRLSDLPAALNAVPENSWPYGRVIAIEEAHDAPAADRPAIRRNVEATIKTLGDLGVVVYEWTDGSFH